MATPPELSPQFMPPEELPPVQMWQPNPPKRNYPPWLPWLAIALMPVIVVCTAVGAYTMASAVARSPHMAQAAATATHKPAKEPRHTEPPKPAYNLAGYQAAISGPEEQAFVAALNQFRRDSKHYKFQSLTTDSLSLSGAASTWLTVLKATNPPRGYQASKLDYLMAAMLANRAAAKTQSGISSASLTALAQGNALATQAKAALARAAESAPKGS